MMKTMKRRLMSAAVAVIFLFALTGCLYPDEQRQAHVRPSQEYITLVQIAVNQFQEKSGVLPIKNSTMETPIYEKYVIDFKKLMERNLLNEPPPNAFESGGNDYYVLVHVEEEPTVKLMDIAAMQSVIDIQRAVDSYRSEHGGRIPAAEALTPGWYSIDYDLLKMKPLQIPSPYSVQSLSLMVNEATGDVMIDYSSEMMKLIQQQGKVSFPEGEDLRELLVQSSPYIPVRSYPYDWNGERPVPALENQY
ncbi:hypothetical protein MALU111345_02595 [Marinicrinis lubricantis]